jgi:hypothetical protein
MRPIRIPKVRSKRQLVRIIFVLLNAKLQRGVAEMRTSSKVFSFFFIHLVFSPSLSMYSAAARAHARARERVKNAFNM